MVILLNNETLERMFIETTVRCDIQINEYKLDVTFKETFYDNNQDSDIELLNIIYSDEEPSAEIRANIEKELHKYLMNNIDNIIDRLEQKV